MEVEAVLKTPNIEKKPPSIRYYREGPPEAGVDLEHWRLSITGLVNQAVNLSFDQLLELPQIEESRRYVCVCCWTVRRTWKGTLLQHVMDLAGIKDYQGLYLKQISLGSKEKGSYESTISLSDAIKRRAMLIYGVDGEPLPLIQGYPLRLIDFGLYGYKSVKGLATLEVTDSLELGEWELFAGYDVNGDVRPKKYWSVDTREHVYINQPGLEVTHF